MRLIMWIVPALQQGTLTADYLVMTLSPAVVLAATAVVKWALPRVPGLYIVAVVVPVFSVGAAWLATLIAPDASFWLQALLGVLATWLREVIAQFGKLKTDRGVGP